MIVVVNLCIEPISIFDWPGGVSKREEGNNKNSGYMDDILCTGECIACNTTLYGLRVNLKTRTLDRRKWDLIFQRELLQDCI